jgi:hypothetical protein
MTRTNPNFRKHSVGNNFNKAGEKIDMQKKVCGLVHSPASGIGYQVIGEGEA